MIEKVIFSGFSGQGILTAGLLFAEAAIQENLEATFYPSYGAEMRGGTANCHVIISDRRIALPIIEQADTLLAFNLPSMTKFTNKIKQNGLILFNDEKKYNINETITILNIPADKYALEKLGSTKMANVLMLGVFIKHKPILSIESLKKSIKKMFAVKNESILELNYKALNLGYTL